MNKKGQETIKHYTDMNDFSWKSILVILVVPPISFALCCSLFMFVFYVVPVSILWVIKYLFLFLKPISKVL